MTIKSSKKSKRPAFMLVAGLAAAVLLVLVSSRTINSNSMTFFNRAATSSLYPIIGWGNAAVFDGLTGYITAKYSEGANPQPGFTAETWFKPHLERGIPIDRPVTLINKINTNVAGEAFMLNLHITSQDGNKFTIGYFWVVNNKGANCQSDWTVSSQRTLNYDQATAWQHIAGVIQTDGRLDLYVNGQRELNSSGQVAGTCQSNAPYRIGAITYGSERGYYDGQMDDVRVSSIARYQNSFAPHLVPFTADSHTILLYHLDENSGATNVFDASSNNFNGYISGSVTFVGSTVPTPPPTTKTGY